jgi:hypothetical protein
VGISQVKSIRVVEGYILCTSKVRRLRREREKRKEKKKKKKRKKKDSPPPFRKRPALIGKMRWRGVS